MRKFFAILVTVVVIAGCSTFDVGRYGVSVENNAALKNGIVDAPRYRSCLTAKGWTREKQWEPAPAGWYRGVE